MLGAIAGDVIGSIYERRNAPCDFPLFSFHSHFTDDTVLTVATAEVLCLDRAPTASDFATAYMRYYKEYPDRGFGSGFKVWAGMGELNPIDSYGNGAAMRVSPVAWAYDSLRDANEASIVTAFYTHNNPEAFRGAKTVTTATFLARENTPKAEIAAQIRSLYGYTLEETPEDLYARFKFSSCQATVPLAVQAFLKGDDFESVVREAIAFGGDSDTIAAMAGSMAEAYYGIPHEIVVETKKRLPASFLKTIETFEAQFGS